MLDKNDLKAIADIIDERVSKIIDEKVPTMITDQIGNFFHDTLAPYLDEKFKENDNDNDTIFRKLEKIDDHLIDHEKRINKLESSLQS